MQIEPASIFPLVNVANYFTASPHCIWGPRTMPDFEFIYVIQGEFSFAAGQKKEKLIEGDLLIIYPEEKHTFVHTGDGSNPGVISCLHSEPVREAKWSEGNMRFSISPKRVTKILPENREHLRALFASCAKYYNESGFLALEKAASVCREIWLILFELWSFGDGAGHSEKMKAMLGWIHLHIREEITRDMLATHSGVTPQYVSELFTRETGFSPTQYIARKRMQLAYRLLSEKGRSIREVSQFVGMSDPYYFSRVFKKVFGVPPSNVGQG